SFHDIYAGLEGLPSLRSQGRKVGLGARPGRRLARNGPIDNGDGRAECGFYIQTRRVEQVRIVGAVEAAIRIGPVAGIAFLGLVVERVAVDLDAVRLELASAPFHAARKSVV